MCDSARCPQATRHPCRRPVWADAVASTTAFIGSLGRTRTAERARLGLVQGAIMAGGVLGAPVAPLLQRHLRPSTMVLTMTLAGTLLFAIAAVVIPSPLVALPVAVVVLLAPAGTPACSPRR